MSFNCISKNGIYVSDLYIPSELQEKIADYVLPEKYKCIYDEVMKQLLVELATGSAMPVNNVEPTMVQTIIKEFHYYDDNSMQSILKHFMDAVYWHSTTHFVKKTRRKLFKSGHENLLDLSYQDLIALRYYIRYLYGNIEVNKCFFTNSWFPPIRIPGHGTIFPWSQNHLYNYTS